MDIRDFFGAMVSRFNIYSYLVPTEGPVKYPPKKILRCGLSVK